MKDLQHTWAFFALAGWTKPKPQDVALWLCAFSACLRVLQVLSITYSDERRYQMILKC